MTISKAQGQGIVDELRPMIEAVFASRGLTPPTIRWSYGAGFEIKANGTVETLNESGVNTSSMEAQYYTNFGHRSLSGVELTAPLGTRFMSNGAEYIFAGIASKRRKYPIYAKKVTTGEGSFFTEAVIGRINTAALAAAK
jgi:hypothetical protein